MQFSKSRTELPCFPGENGEPALLSPFYDFIIGGILGLGLGTIVIHLLSWPSRRYLESLQPLPSDYFQKQYPKKYRVSKIYLAYSMICLILWMLIFGFLILIFLMESNPLLVKFFFLVALPTFIGAGVAISTGLFEVLTQVSATGGETRHHFGGPFATRWEDFRYFYGEAVKQAGKIRILFGSMVLIAVLVVVGIINYMNL